MRTIVIILLDPVADAASGLVEVLVFVIHTSSSFKLRWKHSI